MLFFKFGCARSHCAQVFSSFSECGLLSSCSSGASHCSGWFSGAQALVVAREPSCSRVCGVFQIRDQTHVSCTGRQRFFTTEPPGKPLNYSYNWLNSFPKKKIVNHIFLRLSSWHILHFPMKWNFLRFLCHCSVLRGEPQTWLFITCCCWVLRLKKKKHIVAILLHVIIELGTAKSPYFMTYQVINPTLWNSEKTTLRCFFSPFTERKFKGWDKIS